MKFTYRMLRETIPDDINDYSIAFWYHPRDGRYVDAGDSTHTWVAVEQMGYQPSSGYDHNKLEDYEVMNRVVRDGWVRVGINDAESTISPSKGFFYGNLPEIRITMKRVLDKLDFAPQALAVETPTEHLGWLDPEQIEMFLRGRVRFPVHA